MTKIGIYKITSPTNKIYIGQSIDIERRWGGHKSYIGVGPKLKNSYNSYGFENHIKEIIEECNIDQLIECEIYWKQHYINKYGWEKMLFCEIYDIGGGPKSQETKDKQSISQKQNLSRPEVIEKRKINCKIAANKPGVQERAVVNTDWVKRELNRMKSMNYSQLKKPIIQYNTSGSFIKEWGGFIDIKNELKYDSSSIRKCCKGLQKTAYGFKWEYKNEIF
jgi:group I intron endonuclease